MIELVDSLDKDLLLWLNGFHAPSIDFVMWWVSSTVLWIPFYLFVLLYIIRERTPSWPKQELKQWLFVIISITVAITLADQISSGFFKPFFGRLRPSHSPDLEGLVHLLSDPNGNIYKGGKFGFVSSHAANSFAIAIFVSLVLKSKKVWVVMLSWAAVVSYSRIYLGVHYPGDILGGAIIGILSGLVAAKLYFYLSSKWTD